MSEIIIDGISGSILRQYVERIERLENEKMELLSQIKDIYLEAKSEGLEPRIMRQIMKIRKMKKEDLEEQDALLEIYKKALGMENEVSD